ncbi:MAG: acyl-CoA carboxylase subunit beta [Gaiellales bacterium]|nr:acyl-CoA carboxylase subunit beta [Gaiellales bacterium]MDX6593401.1 acyl-CoA carboxylase subunit beta [Gaiellales bacterium]
MAKEISVDISRVGEQDGELESEAARTRNTCPGCGSHYREEEMVANLRVCAHCGHHFPVTARERIVQLVDEGTWNEIARDLRSADPLEFTDTKPYPERLVAAERQTGLRDAVLVGGAEIGELPVALAVMDFTFLGGSMGSVVGEKLFRAVELAVERRAPLVTVSASGGARMQEGVLALMQMAKTVAAIEELREAGLPYVSVLAHPTTGGVAASFAALGDVIIAEPGALLSFSGPRVVRQTTRENIPDDFGLAESNYRHGHVDMIIPRGELRETVARVAWLLAGGTPYRRTPLLPDLGAQRAVGRILGGARRRLGGLMPERDGG